MVVLSISVLIKPAFLHEDHVLLTPLEKFRELGRVHLDRNSPFERSKCLQSIVVIDCTGGSELVGILRKRPRTSGAGAKDIAKPGVGAAGLYECCKNPFAERGQNMHETGGSPWTRRTRPMQSLWHTPQ